MRTPEVSAYIQEHADLFWFVPSDQKTQVSDEALVETILNYGDMDAILGLISLWGIDRVARIYTESVALSARRKNNYHELTRNYFHHVFKRYAPHYFN